jgi:hypothetical protein
LLANLMTAIVTLQKIEMLQQSPAAKHSQPMRLHPAIV